MSTNCPDCPSPNVNYSLFIANYQLKSCTFVAKPNDGHGKGINPTSYVLVFGAVNDEIKQSQ